MQAYMPNARSVNGWEQFKIDADEYWSNFKNDVEKHVVYVVVGKCFDGTKKVVGSLEGWEKMAGIIIPIAAIALEIDNLEEVAGTLKAIADQFKTFKDLKSPMAWVGVGDDFFKKKCSESKKIFIQNLISAIHRICMAAVAVLGVVEVIVKAKIEIPVYEKKIPLKLVLLLASTSLKLIGNGLTLWTNYRNGKELDLKKAALLGILSDEQKANLVDGFVEKLERLTGKNFKKDEVKKYDFDRLNREILLAKLKNLRKKRLRLEEPQSERGGLQVEELQVKKNDINVEENDLQVDEDDPQALTKTIAYERALLKYDSKKAIIMTKRETIAKNNENEDPQKTEVLKEETRKLIEEVAALQAGAKADKQDAKAFQKMELHIFVDYKMVARFEVRANNLSQEWRKTWIDVATCAFKLAVSGLELGAKYVGVEVLSDKLGTSESTFKIIQSSLSLFSGSYGMFQFLHDEYNKEPQKEVRAAGYYAACA